jgi:hypothetical protein
MVRVQYRVLGENDRDDAAANVRFEPESGQSRQASG